jgi:hypothetical protein
MKAAFIPMALITAGAAVTQVRFRMGKAPIRDIEPGGSIEFH